LKVINKEKKKKRLGSLLGSNHFTPHIKIIRLREQARESGRKRESASESEREGHRLA
jgi:hypothetical protein